MENKTGIEKIAEVLAIHTVSASFDNECGCWDLTCRTCGEIGTLSHTEAESRPYWHPEEAASHQAEMIAAALESVIREREATHDAEVAAKTLEDAADALDREGVTFQKSWGSNARDEGMICGIATTGNWLHARAAGIKPQI